MNSFETFLQETDSQREEIDEILSTLTDEEINEFGNVLAIEFFDDDESDDYFELSDVEEMISELGTAMFGTVLEFLEIVEEPVEETVSRIMKKSNMNRKKRKFMKNSKSALRKTAATRKKENRKKKVSRKRNRRANKQKIKNYQKSRNKAIKKGTHKVKLRRKAG